MSTPQNVLDALNALQADADAEASAQAALSQAQATLASAQAAVESAQSNLASTQGKKSQDYQSVLSLLAQTYEPTAPKSGS